MNHLAIRRLLSKWMGFGWFYIVALIPGLVVVAVVSYAIYQDERNDLEQASFQTARALLSAVDAELGKAQSTALALAKAESLKSGNLSGFYGQAHEVSKALGAGSHFVLSDLKGQQLLHTARPMGDALPLYGNPEQLQRVVKRGRPVVSGLYVDPVLKKPMVGIDVPVFYAGKPVYVLSVGLMPEPFNALLTAQKLPEGWIATVLDEQDSVVAHNSSSGKLLASKAAEDVRRKIALSREGTLASRTAQGEPTFAAFKKSDNTQWTVVVGMTQAALYRDGYRLMALVGLALLVFIGCGVAAAWFYGAYVRRALKALGAAARLAPSGDSVALVPMVSGIYEVDQLAGQFNAMREAQHRMENRLREMAFYDPLTSLANRRLLVERLQQALAHNKRMGYRGALMTLDLDNFKPLNDAHGHAAGDVLLCEVADRLERSVREVDTVARLGGDEFVVLMVGLRGDEAEATLAAAQLAEKIRTRMAEPYFLNLQAEGPPSPPVEHHCTVSMGATLFSDQEAGPGEILEHADAALSQAKSAGRNMVRFAKGGAA